MTGFFHHLPFFILAPDRFPIALLAMTVTALIGIVTGSVGGNANPLLWRILEILLGRFGARLDRKGRQARDLILRGFMVTVLGISLAALCGLAAQKLKLQYPFMGATEIILLSLTLSSGAVWRALLKLSGALKNAKKPAKGAYYAIARSTRTDLSGADDFAITRSGMGFAARSFDKAVVAPVIWYLLAGLPGAYIYAGVAALSWLFTRDGFSGGFGLFAWALEVLMGIVPSFLAGIIIALAGLFTPTGGMTRAFRGLLTGKGRAPYAEGGLPLTAMAWSLNVSLGGPVQDSDGRSLKRAWTGPKNATARLESGHLKRGLYIVLMAYLLFMALLMGGYQLVR